MKLKELLYFWLVSLILEKLAYIDSVVVPKTTGSIVTTFLSKRYELMPRQLLFYVSEKVLGGLNNDIKQ